MCKVAATAPRVEVGLRPTWSERSEPRAAKPSGGVGAPVCEGRACAHRAVWRHHPARSRSDRKQFRSRAGLPRLSCGTDSSDGALMGGPGPVTFNLRWPGPVSICQGPSGGVGAAGRCEGAPRLSPGLPPPPCHLPGSTGTVPLQGGTAAEPFPAMAPSRKSRSSARDQAPSRLDGGPGPVTFNLRWPGPVSICQGHLRGQTGTVQVKSRRLRSGQGRAEQVPVRTGTVPVRSRLLRSGKSMDQAPSADAALHWTRGGAGK